MTERFPLAVDGISLSVTAIGGLIDEFAVEREGRRIMPLHRAPWVDRQREIRPGEAPHLALLSGDFFCAPFGAVKDAPPHGWTANGHWSQRSLEDIGSGSIEAVFDLAEHVQGASVEKRIVLRPGHPVVYQTHKLRGGHGRIPISHHAMIHAPRGAALAFSAKDFGGTPAHGLGAAGDGTRSVLAYPQRFERLDAVSLGSGDTVDASRYPFAEQHEDLLTLFDPADAILGWSTATTAGFVFFAIKDASVLCQTTLWMSNGGRPFAPWNGRHTHVLGIEESCSHFGDGEEASARDNDLSRAGYRTAVDLGAEVVVRYALGAVPLPPDFSRVVDVSRTPQGIELVDAGGARHGVPFDTGFFGHW